MDRASPIRKRMRRYEAAGDVRFVTFSCHQRLPLLSLSAIRDRFQDALVATRARTGIELFAWVVMPEHVHLLCRAAAGGTLSPALHGLKISVSKAVVARWRHLNAPILARLRDRDGAIRFWQRGGGFDRNVRDEEELSRTIRYVHRNPVERSLVEQPEEW